MNERQHPFKHVAIIMDGNGRWAQVRSHSRVWGHVRGANVVADIVSEASALGIEALTLYAFSTENWCRPLSEIKTLFNLLRKFLLRERNRILKNKISFKVIGDISKLPQETQNLILDIERESHNFEGLKLTFAFGYGGRDEIIRACNNFICENPGELLTKESLRNFLFLPELDDVDLLIRTGGEQRVSNFLLWQIAYAELYFTKTHWPNFERREFRKIIQETSLRERRFGYVDKLRDQSESTYKAKENQLEILNDMGAC